MTGMAAPFCLSPRENPVFYKLHICCLSAHTVQTQETTSAHQCGMQNPSAHAHLHCKPLLNRMMPYPNGFPSSSIHTTLDCQHWEELP